MSTNRVYPVFTINIGLLFNIIWFFYINYLIKFGSWDFCFSESIL